MVKDEITKKLHKSCKIRGFFLKSKSASETLTFEKMEEFLSAMGKRQRKQVEVDQFTIQISKMSNSLSLQSKIIRKIYHNCSLAKRFYDPEIDQFSTFPYGCKSFAPSRQEAKNVVELLEKLDAQKTDKTLALSNKKNWPCI